MGMGGRGNQPPFSTNIILLKDNVLAEKAPNVEKNVKGKLGSRRWNVTERKKKSQGSKWSEGQASGRPEC